MRLFVVTLSTDIVVICTLCSRCRVFILRPGINHGCFYNDEDIVPDEAQETFQELIEHVSEL